MLELILESPPSIELWTSSPQEIKLKTGFQKLQNELCENRLFWRYVDTIEAMSARTAGFSQNGICQISGPGVLMDLT